MRKPLTKDQQAKVKAILCVHSKHETNKKTGEFSFYCELMHTRQYMTCLKCASTKFDLGGGSDGE